MNLLRDIVSTARRTLSAMNLFKISNPMPKATPVEDVKNGGGRTYRVPKKIIYNPKAKNVLKHFGTFSRLKKFRVNGIEISWSRKPMPNFE